MHHCHLLISIQEYHILIHKLIKYIVIIFSRDIRLDSVAWAQMGHQKRRRIIDVTRGTKLSVTLTFRRIDRFELQFVNSASYISKYLSAYKTIHLAPELGEGRLHWHYCGEVKDVLKHKIFMHNWNALYGTVHVDTWDGTDTFIKYVTKENLLYNLVPSIGQDVIFNTSLDIKNYIKKYKERYFKEVRVDEKSEDTLKVYRILPISEYFTPAPKAHIDNPNGVESPAVDPDGTEEEYQAYMNALADEIEDSSDSDC